MKTRIPYFRARAGFSLVELMVSMAVLSLVMLVLLSITGTTQSIWKQTSQRIDAFRAARSGFESMTRRLSQATLNTYWDYDNANAPTRYVRRSELRFLSGTIPAVAAALNAAVCPTQAAFFQAPLGFVADTKDYNGMENLLNTFGYYVKVSSDKYDPNDPNGTKPQFLAVPDRTRFRLMQLSEPSEILKLYTYSNGVPGYNGTDWFAAPLATLANSHVIADNVIALVLLPKLSAQEDSAGTALAPNYTYSTAPVAWPPATPQATTENQLAPLVQVTMVAIDETSAARLASLCNNDPAAMVAKLGLGNLFTTAGSLSDPTQPGYAQDLKTLTDTLQSLHLKYRVFNSEVSIRGAKWSKK